MELCHSLLLEIPSLKPSLLLNGKAQWIKSLDLPRLPGTTVPSPTTQLKSSWARCHRTGISPGQMAALQAVDLLLHMTS